MITKTLALALTFGQEIHLATCRRDVGPRGGVTEKIFRWRVNGKCKIWKTRPGEFELPIKYGLKTFGYVTRSNGGGFHVVGDCPIKEEAR